MDYCNPANQIGTYASAGSGGSGGCFADPLIVKNIDCVSLESDSVNTQTLTIDGVPFSNTTLLQISDKTQHQTATTSPSVTDFNGTLKVDDLEILSGSLTSVGINANTINPKTTNGTITITAPVSQTGLLTVNSSTQQSPAIAVNDTITTSGGTLLSLLQSQLTANNAVKIMIGKSSSSGEAGEIAFNLRSVAADNFLQVGLAGISNSGLQIRSTYTDIPTELRIANKTLLPRTTSPTVSLTNVTPLNTTILTNIPNTARVIIVSITNWRKSPNTNSPILFVGANPTSTVTYLGNTSGNNAAASLNFSTSGVPMWNNSIMPSDPTGYTRYFNTIIELTYNGVRNGVESWNVSGYGSEFNLENSGTGRASQYWVQYAGVLNIITTGSNLNSVGVSFSSGNWSQGDCSVTYY